MTPLLPPLHLLLIMFAGCVNRHQLDVIDYLRKENRELTERLAGDASGSPISSAGDTREKLTHSGAKS